MEDVSIDPEQPPAKEGELKEKEDQQEQQDDVDEEEDVLVQLRHDDFDWGVEDLTEEEMNALEAFKKIIPEEHRNDGLLIFVDVY